MQLASVVLFIYIQGCSSDANSHLLSPLHQRLKVEQNFSKGRQEAQI